MGEGSGAAIFTLLPAALARRGHEVRVSLPAARDSEVPAAPEVSGQPYHGFTLHRHPARRGYVPNPAQSMPTRLADRLECWLRFQREGYAAARRVSRSHPPDLVIGMGIYEAPVARRLARALGISNVTRIFGTALSLHLDQPLRFYANFPEVLALRTPCARLIWNDDGADGRAVAARLRLPPERITYLRNGLDFDRFRPGPSSLELRARLGLRPRQKVLLTGTRLAPEKKLERCIEGLSSALSLGSDVVLVLPGDGPERERLRAAARAAPGAPPGGGGRPPPPPGVPGGGPRAAGTLSLLDRTNAANPVYEAMACGCPVVALDAGTTRDVVRDGLTGIILAPEDLPRLGAALHNLLSDEDHRRRLGQAASIEIRRLILPIDRRMESEVELIEQAAGRKRRARTEAGPPAVRLNSEERRG